MSVTGSEESATSVVNNLFRLRVYDRILYSNSKTQRGRSLTQTKLVVGRPHTMAFAEQSLLYSRAVQILNDQFHCKIPPNCEEKSQDDETSSLNCWMNNSELATQWIQSVFVSSEANGLPEKILEEEHDLFAQCIVAVCGALPTFISISQDLLRTSSTTLRTNDMLRFVMYRALPMLLFHTSKICLVSDLIQTDDAPAMCPIHFSIWRCPRMNCSTNILCDVPNASVPHSEVTLYHNIITNIMTLPSVIGSVSSYISPDGRVPFPKWILSEYIYFTQLLMGSLYSVIAADAEAKFSSSVTMFRTFLRHLLRRRQGYYVAASLCRFLVKNSQSETSSPKPTSNPNPPSLGQCLQGLLFPSETTRGIPCGVIPYPDEATYLSGGEGAILYRSVLRYVLSTKGEIILTEFENKIPLGGLDAERGSEDWKYLSILMELCHPLLQCFSAEICHLLVLSSSSVDSKWRMDCRLLALLVLHLSMTPSAIENEPSDTNDVVDDCQESSLHATVSNQALDLEIPQAITDSSSHMPPFLLYRSLCDIASTWSQLTFVLQTEDRLQRHVTRFLLAGISLLIRYHERIQRNVDDCSINQPILFYTTLSMELLEGITTRLGSMNNEIRRDGMEIGEQVAALLGQPSVKFEELHSGATEETIVEEVSVFLDGPNVSVDDHDDDSDWEEGSAPADRYGNDDDRLDLLTSPLPLYLSECLDYLRTPETDESIASRHETVLRHLSSLVRSRPADLVDVSVELARSVLRLENKYNIPEFSTLVADSLCSLVVEDPLTVGINLIAELFEDGSLSDRLTILHSLDHGAYELSGMNPPETKSQGNGLGLPLLDVPKISGSAAIGVLEERTRRWGKSRHSSVKPKRLENQFAAVAPEWFYLLIGRFVKCKENTTLWGGDVGAIFLSSLILTLSRILSGIGPCAPGVDIMAKDLLELVWSFRLADTAEVRLSVLYAAGTSMGILSENSMMALFLDSTDENLITSIQLMSEKDPDQKCRALANQLRSVVAASLKLMDHSHLMIERH